MQVRPRRFLVWGLACAVLAFAVDQATKAAALAAAPAPARGIEVLPFFDLVSCHRATRHATFPQGRGVLPTGVNDKGDLHA